MVTPTKPSDEPNISIHLESGEPTEPFTPDRFYFYGFWVLLLLALPGTVIDIVGWLA